MLHFTSSLEEKYQEELEKLLFFNPGQHRAYSAIVDSLELFGTPSTAVEDGNIRVNVEKLADVQSIFALDEDTLVGALIFSRVSNEHIAVVHIAAHNDYASHGIYAEKMLVIRMVNLLRKSARGIKGVEAICVMHGHQKIQQVPV